MTIRIGTSVAGGTFHGQGAALAEILNRSDPAHDARVAETEMASVGNANRLEDGEIDFGFMASNWIGRAREGAAPFARMIDLAMAAPMNAGPLFFVALAGSTLRTVSDLAGRRVAVGPENSGMTQHVHTIFDALGMAFNTITPAYLGFEEGADALAEGTVDAQFQCPIPNQVMTDLSQRARVRVLGFGRGEIERVLSAVPFYRETVMEAGAFRGLDADIPQIAVLNILVTHARVPGELVAAVVKGIVGNAAELGRIDLLFRGLGQLFEPLRTQGPAALEMGGVALHPGALRAYRDTGLLG